MIKTSLFIVAVSIGLVLTQVSDPVLVGAGDIANCSRTQDESTAQLLDGIAGTVVTLGDNAYPDGTLMQFNDCYGPSWGRHKDRTRPSPGNHDYHQAEASGYFGYFGASAGDPTQGYYSYDLGTWHIIVLNSEIASGAGSSQEQWLRSDLASHSNTCTLAYWHKPRFSSGQHGNNLGVQSLWQALYDYRADVVLNGHDHLYERFALQNPSGQADSNGIREFVVGTGGAGLYSFVTIQPNSEVRENTTWGVLKLTLHPTSYDWEFVPIAGQTFTDTGSANCVSTEPIPTATPTPVPLSPIFSDSFESGNLLAWTSSKTDCCDLSVSDAAALVGNKGMQAVLDDNITIFVTDDRPATESHYRAKFYFDPNSISMADKDVHYIFNGLMGTSTVVLRTEFRRFSGNYQIRVRALSDGTAWVSTSWFTLSDAPHLIELDWRSSTATGANDGGLTLWVDDVHKSSLISIDNDTRRIDRVRLGAVSGIDSGTRGMYYFDAFESWR